ncbi:phosphate acyltransferase PlsX [Marinibactrum halimedae]|uniref:Phosphate acyltransferase n=1 Tax=Marinibactrum halimedae TaxID=1444977 RepID=A0AA37WNW0_9GAMM|nr:phosphate acyltransferase PlsX [Marinibactrum halimedae]MCD9460110.1 phosphate acyltransferase PlsX [Marinibactrum halimedae]GLS26511.1 phosphate acyltransferase [Marinibactrum halimedae]
MSFRPQLHLAVDAMGGDYGPRSTVPASIQFLQQNPQAHITLYLHQSLTGDVDASHPSLTIKPCSSFVSMSDSPSRALRYLKDSTLAMALQSVSSGEAHACVSAGNTGAMVAIARHFWGTFTGLKRPAICKPIPTVEGGHSYMLDLGANVTATPDLLHAFALLGAAVSHCCDQVVSPRVALLNIGDEVIKGHEDVKAAAGLLESDGRLNYIGFVEGDAIYSGMADVIVCDGFAGNIALKVSEGVARMAVRQVNDTFRTSLYGQLLGQFARPVLKKWQRRFDPARYNGASFLGLNHVLVKSHGGADARGFGYALSYAQTMVQQELVPQLRQSMEGCFVS